MNEWGIKNYQPYWTNSSIELASRLLKASLEDLKIQSIWMLWDNEEQQWFEDAPVVINTATKQLEFCANKLEYFSFSFNSIDLSAPVYWCLSEDEVDETEQPMYWMEVNNSKTNSLLNNKITEVFVIEYRMDRSLQKWLNKNEWSLHGVGFYLENCWLRILNGLNCNRLDYEVELDSSLRNVAINSNK